MFKIGEHVVYRTTLCKIIDIKKIDLKNDKEYYLLQSIDDPSLTIKVPTDCSTEVIRHIISKEKIEKLINEIPSINIIESDLKNLESEYMTLLKSGDHLDLIKIIKTSHLRNEERKSLNKKASEKDSNYFNKAEHILYSEFAASLGLSYEDTKHYIISKVSSLIEKK